jgi:hypothetical protein
MAGPEGRHRSRVVYRTYDDRAISQETIERVLTDWEAEQRRMAKRQTLRVWALAALLVLLVIAACVFVCWRLGFVL